jgi:DNA mismatch repair protein MutS
MASLAAGRAAGAVRAALRRRQAALAEVVAAASKVTEELGTTKSKKQVYEAKKQHPDCIVLMQQGGFYQAYEKDAQWLHRRLGLTLTKKQDMEMVGFPLENLANTLERLMAPARADLRVAVCTQADNPDQNEGIMNRPVNRVISPGTAVVLENFEEDGFLVAVARPGGRASAECKLARIDCTGTIEERTYKNADELCAELRSGSFAAKELLVSPALLDDLAEGGLLCSRDAEDALGEERAGVPELACSPLRCLATVLACRGCTKDAACAECDRPGPGDSASDALRVYFKLAKMELPSSTPSRAANSAALIYRSNSLRSLEVLATQDGGTSHALITALGKPRTPPGRRELRDRILRPLLDVAAINLRLGSVQVLYEHLETCRKVRRELAKKECADLMRVLHRVEMALATTTGGGKGSIEDLVLVRGTLQTAKAVSSLLRSMWEGRLAVYTREREETELQQACAAMDASLDGDLRSLLDTLEKGVYKKPETPKTAVKNKEPEMDEELETRATEEAPSLMDSSSTTDPSESEERLISEGFDSGVDEARAKVKKLMNELLDAEKEAVSSYDFEVKYDPGPRALYFSSLSKKKKAKTEAKTKATLNGKEVIPLGYKNKKTSERLSSRAGEYAKLHDDVEMEERRVVRKLVDGCLRVKGALDSVARSLAVIDVTCTLAIAAFEHALWRPVVDGSSALRITQGRHFALSIQRQSGPPRNFAPNDLDVAASGEGGAPSCVLLTGSNMAGKSTYLKMCAHVAVLAQMGSFVPAVSARVGVVDQLFSRVGASDDISTSRSTFMVEAGETAEILRLATARSLVVVDEIGRGTCTSVGPALAQAVLERLVALGPRTLFSTHFRELAALEARLAGRVVAFQAVTRTHPRHGIIFMHTIERGVSSASHGLDVAELAGVPGDTLERAHALLADSDAPPLCGASLGAIVRSLEAVNVDKLSPAAARRLLGELRAALLA